VKKFNNTKVSLRVDPITDEYTLIIPESFINHFDWFEGSELNMSIEADGLYIEESDD
jgi:hypothetical protein|tara:strand:+ start:243 stop:413 length:171 start_codon:yes stop_codon:yes gene_type:complete